MKQNFQFYFVILFFSYLTECLKLSKNLKQQSFIFSTYRENSETFPNPYDFSSKLSQKFKKMVDNFSNYSTEDILSIENNRLKYLILCGKQALDEPKVVRSFSILYEDLLPVRLGGDILFNLLDKSINNAKVNKETLKKTIKSTRLSVLETQSSINKFNSTLKSFSGIKSKIIKEMVLISKASKTDNYCQANILFDKLDVNKDGSISPEEFMYWVESVLVKDDEESADWKSMWEVDALYQDIDANKDGSISYEEIELWTTGVLNQDGCDPFDEMNAAEFIISSDGIIQGLEINDPPKSKNQAIAHAKYKHMLETFANASDKWIEDPNPTRFDMIISGCFAGAKNPGVVKALEILYEDYLPLQVAGDIIFNLIKKSILK